MCICILGTRMWRRGANLEGDTANFIETEQLLEFEGYMSSFLQVCFQLLSLLGDNFSDCHRGLILLVNLLLLLSLSMKR